MKIKNLKKSSNNNELIKLKFLKFYPKQTSTQKVLLQTHLIKIFNIIYQYNFINKKILFVGFPSSYKNSLKKIKHEIIPDYLTFNGILTNKEFVNNTIKNVGLIVIQNENSTIKKESYKNRIPTISLNNKQNLTNDTAYRWLNNYKSFKKRKASTDLFLTFLKTTFLKTK